MKVNTLKLIGDSLPANIRQISDPPGVLYWQGAAPEELLNRPKVAVVGSRKFTGYGLNVTGSLASKLARQGILIISGLALGIDSIAHQAALEVGGLTLAVLPASLDHIYPPSHRGLAENILKSGGALVSEYSQAEAYPANFIARNRIISGLADGLLITEAAAASGTMHTARFALEQGKTVMVVPGNITSPSSEGCNNLIKAGAIPITNAEDIFFALKLETQEKKNSKIFKGTAAEQLILDLISGGTSDQDELASISKLDGAILSSSLTLLEIKGYIKPLGSGHWAIA